MLIDIGIMKQLKNIIVLLFVFYPLCIIAQDRTVEYWGWVEDFVTHTAINDAKVTSVRDKGKGLEIW